jgi:hypothetical protein
MAQATSGQITVTTAGTEVQGPSVQAQGFFIKAKPANTGLVYVGNDGNGAVASTTGFGLSAGDTIYWDAGGGGNLSALWFDSAVNGEGFYWLAVNPWGV